MANLRTAMDSAFWDLEVASPRLLEGTAKAVPGEPLPMDGARASKALRIQQLSLLRNGFPLGIIPSFSPTARKDLGSFSLQSLFLRPAISKWWLGVIGQIRPKKLISNIKAEFLSNDDSEFPTFNDVAKHFLDKSIYSLGLCTQFSLTPSSSIKLSTEGHGEEERRHKMMLFHKFPNHDVILEAAWPQLFIDHKGQYWNVPESISLDLLSLVSESGFRYRLGMHRNSGHPQALDSTNADAPAALMPGFGAKAAFSYEKSRDFWRQKQRQQDMYEKTNQGIFWWPPYDVCLGEPHSAISGIIGGNCTMWFDSSNIAPKKRSPFGADLFGSVCYTFQHGKFKELYGDLTRVDARLDICSASAFAKRLINGIRRSSVNSAEDPMSSPRLNLIFQQQVAGPIVFRVDSRISLASLPGNHGPHIEDSIFSLNYSLRLLKSGKVVAWYSPKRKEGMIELRLFEF
ncbi:protein TRIGALACTOSYLDIACYLGLYCEROL 4, chloroplastic [Ziziphus jujuba]|uniref:Protein TRIGALACTOSYLDIACYLGLYCEROL 4, chloroplastic n=1 Tax=Ziziphus jujuba TaxID=326968 RepID=A0A6P3YR46_ZIZJJ|nr:protein TRIGALACTOSYLDIACYLGLYCEROL 4, chloroplastic [Ziziphus jujuba]